MNKIKLKETEGKRRLKRENKKKVKGYVFANCKEK